MKIDSNEMGIRAINAYKNGDKEEYDKLEREFIDELNKAIADGDDHCSCTNKCVMHGKCVECVAMHRAHADHLPACFRDMLNAHFYKLSSLTEHTVIGTIKKNRLE